MGDILFFILIVFSVMVGVLSHHIILDILESRVIGKKNGQ